MPAVIIGLGAGVFCYMALKLRARLKLDDSLDVWAYSFGVTFILLKVMDRLMGLNVTEEEEVIGLDIAQHGERAYGS